ncbi:unnamed protein product [Cuscuta epithymum]|uniref:Uncharacterized protein n=1 Tax=Cuscuta epithymum TaxID=186058 RepID=A0AAV0FI96_9ASTE|nr:unnamed protein product [Cuscuta epithymum]
MLKLSHKFLIEQQAHAHSFEQLTQDIAKNFTTLQKNTQETFWKQSSDIQRLAQEIEESKKILKKVQEEVHIDIKTDLQDVNNILNALSMASRREKTTQMTKLENSSRRLSRQMMPKREKTPQQDPPRKDRWQQRRQLKLEGKINYYKKRLKSERERQKKPWPKMKPRRKKKTSSLSRFIEQSENDYKLL